MYVAVKGGERAIDNAHELLAKQRRGDPQMRELSVSQIRQQLGLAVDRVMAEGSLYDPELAALAIKQASGDLVEAIFLLRAYRTTLPRLATTVPVDTAKMLLARRISATFKDIPGGQLLGPTYDYSHRLLDFSLLAEAEPETGTDQPCSHSEFAEREAISASVPGVAPSTRPDMGEAVAVEDHCPRILELLNQEGLIEAPEETEAAGYSVDTPADLTRDPLTYPADRAMRLQSLARGDEGYLLALGYSTQRGYGRNHPFAGEIRQGTAELIVCPEELGFEIVIGDIAITECEMINQFVGSNSKAPEFTRGYGLVFGGNERKALSMALVDRALRADEFDEGNISPAQNEEFVLSHCDNVEASGFVGHLKLPHYVDFQAELELVRRLRQEFQDLSKESPDYRSSFPNE